MKSRFLKITLTVVTLLMVLYFAIPQLLAIRRSPTSSEAVVQKKTIVVGVDLKHIPIGDGQISTQPQVGSVWSCRTHFGGDGIGGAQASGSWIHPDGTYDLTTKPIVDGAIQWPHKFDIKRKNDIRTISGNRLPKDPTGKFPISPSDDAYAYDRNPNSIAPSTYQVNFSAMPQLSETPSCLPLGEIGVLVNGGYFFNALDAAGKDAVAHEIQDQCQGHPEITGAYHYHNVTSCLENKYDGQGHSALVGYAFDGFGIYGHHGENGKVLTNADLDGCHGHTHTVAWDGQKLSLYHYHATWQYPYTVGCYRGTPVKV
jgi:hypothetical protein